MSNPESNADGRFVVSAKRVAIGSSVLALGCLATLAIVVGVQKVDILSTVALALAILAFVVQLIVYIVQSSSAASQLADARTLHGEMMTVLAEIQERTVGTQRSIDLIQQQVVEELRAKAAGNAAAEGLSSDPRKPQAQVDPELSSGLVLSLMNEEREARRLSETPDQKYPPPPSPSIAAAIHSELADWPSGEDQAEITEDLAQRDPIFLSALDNLLNDSFKFTAPGRTFGPGVPLSSPRVVDLIADGYAEKIPGWKLAVPSAKGRRLGRVFTAIGDPPEWMPASLLEARKSFSREDPSTYREDP